MKRGRESGEKGRKEIKSGKDEREKISHEIDFTRGRKKKGCGKEIRATTTKKKKIM